VTWDFAYRLPLSTWILIMLPPPRKIPATVWRTPSGGYLGYLLKSVLPGVINQGAKRRGPICVEGSYSLLHTSPAPHPHLHGLPQPESQEVGRASVWDHVGIPHATTVPWLPIVHFYQGGGPVLLFFLTAKSWNARRHYKAGPSPWFVVSEYTETIFLLSTSTLIPTFFPPSLTPFLFRPNIRLVLLSSSSLSVSVPLSPPLSDSHSGSRSPPLSQTISRDASQVRTSH
jgi:hypothetical protein